MARRLPDGAHGRRPWRIHEITDDFRVEDLWAFRTPGAGPDDFPAVLAAMRAPRDPAADPLLFRILFAVRWKLGALLGWDGPGTGVGARVRSLRDRLPGELRQVPPGATEGFGPFTPVYELADECALELANKTVHTVMHLGWVPTGDDRYELRMAVLVKPNGPMGRAYMAAIAPLRRLVVLPAFIRRTECAWQRHGRTGPDAHDVGADTCDIGPATCGAGPDARGTGAFDVTVGAHDLPAPFRALSSLSAVDYADRFTLAANASATPEQWARAMFGDVPGLAQRVIWRGLLGLRLSRGRSPDTVAGWRITGRGKDWIRLETASWFLTGNLVVQADGGQVSLGTFLRYDRPLGRKVWPPLSAVHRRLAPGLLLDAVAEVEDRTHPDGARAQEDRKGKTR
ncbi:DUF2867 domain-containing protein [Streptomyces sp. NPDC001732]